MPDYGRVVTLGIDNFAKRSRFQVTGNQCAVLVCGLIDIPRGNPVSRMNREHSVFGILRSLW
jgi:hypothetical protein